MNSPDSGNTPDTLIPWLSWARRLFAGFATGEQIGFVDAILRQVEPGLMLQDPAIGTWYAKAEAADWEPGREADRVAIQFLLDRKPQRTSRIEAPTPLMMPVEVNRLAGEADARPDSLSLIFNFSSAWPVPANLDYFKEFAINQLKRLRVDGPASRTS
jgi:hypothetical protein